MNKFQHIGDVSDLSSLIALGQTYAQNPLIDASKGTGLRLGLLFFNPSLRTRLSTQIAARNLGMEAIVFSVGADGWQLEFEDGAVMNGTTVEHIKDAAPIFGAYFDILAVRTFPSLTDRELDYSEKVFNSFVKYSNIPVVSLESATLHPLQSLADVLTISEYLPVNRKAKVVLQWAPHIKPLPQCVANSFAQWMNDWEDVDLTIAAPAGYELCSEFTGSAQLSNHPTEAIADADFVYVKNWSSYTLYGQMPPVSDDWMLTEAAFMQQNTKVMHCLPVRRNVVLSDEILDGPRSLVQLQAKNRIPAAQAVLSKIIDGLK